MVCNEFTGFTVKGSPYKMLVNILQPNRKVPGWFQQLTRTSLTINLVSLQVCIPTLLRLLKAQTHWEGWINSTHLKLSSMWDSPSYRQLSNFSQPTDIQGATHTGKPEFEFSKAEQQCTPFDGEKTVETGLRGRFCIKYLMVSFQSKTGVLVSAWWAFGLCTYIVKADGTATFCPRIGIYWRQWLHLHCCSRGEWTKFLWICYQLVRPSNWFFHAVWFSSGFTQTQTVSR